MSDFKFNKPAYETAAQKITNASKDLDAAAARVENVNKTFVKSAGGLWAAAELSLCGVYEVELRSVVAGMDNLATNVKKTGDDVVSNIFPARDSVFEAVGQSAQNRDDAALIGGGNAVSGQGIDAQFKVGDVRSACIKIINGCNGLDDSGGITAPISSLKDGMCSDCQSKIMDTQGAFGTYKSEVEGFEGSHKTTFDAVNFITPEMGAAAITGTLNNMGFKDVPSAVSMFKTMLSDFGATFKGEKFIGWHEEDSNWVKANVKGETIDGITTYHYDEATKRWVAKTDWSRWDEVWKGAKKKLGEKTQGLFTWDSNGKFNGLKNGGLKKWFDGFKKQHAKNFSELTGPWADKIKYNNTVKSLEAAADAGQMTKYAASEAIDSLPTPKMNLKPSVVGKSMKAAGRYLGVVGTAMDLWDVGSDSVKAFQENGGGSKGAQAAAGQVAKGAVKIGAGYVIGAVIGSAFGGPLGTVAGAVVGGLIQGAVSSAIDYVFAQNGVKNYE